MAPTKPAFYRNASSTGPASGMTTPSIVLPPEMVEMHAPTPLAQSSTPIITAPQADLSSLDLSLPLSTLLKSGTKIAHADAEHSPGAIALATGTLELSEYVRYLVFLWVVYRVLEDKLDEVVARGSSSSSTDGSVDALYALWSDEKGKGRMLRRSDGLAEDIIYYLDYLNIPAPSSEGQLDSIPFPTPDLVRDIITSPPSDLQAFTDHLTSTSASPHPGRLLAHAYVRYLGDLSGGQLVAAKIRRVYSLPPPPGGTAFYEFDLDEEGSGRGVSVHKQGGKEGDGGDTLYERKKKVEGIKNWFRDCMDMNVGDDEALKAELVQEAITSFRLSTRIFSLLQPPSPSTTPAGSTDSSKMGTLQQRRRVPGASEPAASVGVEEKSKSEKSSTSSPSPSSLNRNKINPLENPYLPANTERMIKLGLLVFVVVAYKVMSYLMLEEGEGFDRAGSRLAKLLGYE